MTSVAPGADGSNGGGDPPRDNKKKPTEKMDRVEADNSGNDTRKKGKGALASMSDASPSSGTGLSSRGLSSKGLTEPTTTPATTNPVVASPGPSSPPPSDMSIPNLLSEVTETLQNQSLRSTPSSAASGSGTPNADTGKRKLDALGNEQVVYHLAISVFVSWADSGPARSFF
ncbi:hypothetical protein BDW74DRAFT_153929 [Aspergillus multicolor]|uniref:uncharacterized protein n=1 Tax=Aspergillus multicolor TaxID=41759 RepID=UPI003CCCCAC5